MLIRVSMVLAFNQHSYYGSQNFSGAGMKNKYQAGMFWVTPTEKKLTLIIRTK